MTAVFQYDQTRPAYVRIFKYMMPVPEYLSGIVLPKSSVIDETQLDAVVRCPCGSCEFDILYPGETHSQGNEIIPCTVNIENRFYFVIVVKCAICHRKHMLFDKDFHGYDGVVNHDVEQAKMTRPSLVPWKCLKCNGTTHSASITLQTEGKDTLDDEDANKYKWVDLFGYFMMGVKCASCGKETPEFVGYETR